MDNEIYDRMLAGYDLSDTAKRRNAIFEVNQQIILAGLYNGGFFDKAAFYGGTCLRIFYGLKLVAVRNKYNYAPDSQELRGVRFFMEYAALWMHNDRRRVGMQQGSMLITP